MKPTILALIIASPVSAATLAPGPHFIMTDYTFDTDGMASPYGTVWAPGPFTMTLNGMGGDFTATFERHYWAPGEVFEAWWVNEPDFGSRLQEDHGDFVVFGGCPVHGGIAMREGRAEPWDMCGDGSVTIYTPDDEDPSPVPLPAAGLLLAGGLVMLRRVR